MSDAYVKVPNYNYQAQSDANNRDENEYTAVHATLVSNEERQSRREDTPKQFRDLIWAIAFYVHLAIMIAWICIGLQSEQGLPASSYTSIISVVGVTGAVAVGISVGSLSFMMKNSIVLVQAALIFSVATSLAIGIVGFMTGSILMGVLGLLSFAVGICYAKVVWNRIPFAAANLNTALSAVKDNLGLAVVSLGFTAIAFAWTILWFLGVGNALSGSNLAIVFFLVSHPFALPHYFLRFSLISLY